MLDLEIDWSKLSTGMHIKYLELVGFTIIPNVLSEEIITTLSSEMEKLELATSSYAPQRKYRHNIQWEGCPTALAIVGQPKIVAFLRRTFGDKLLCTGCTYAESRPGYQGMPLHTDSQPYGSKIFGMQSSSPILVRVLYYLDDISHECSPLTVIPYSHLNLHTDANPYRRYTMHSDSVELTCSAGSAVIINQRLFHGVAPNSSDKNRRLYAVSYRPHWAGPIASVPDHSVENLSKLPENIRIFFASLNTKSYEFDMKNWREDMPDGGDNLSTSRWLED